MEPRASSYIPAVFVAYFLAYAGVGFTFANTEMFGPPPTFRVIFGLGTFGFAVGATALLFALRTLET